MYKLDSSSSNGTGNTEAVNLDCLSLRRLRNNTPLLVIYYPENISQMHDDDMETLDYEIRNQGFGFDV